MDKLTRFTIHIDHKRICFRARTTVMDVFAEYKQDPKDYVAVIILMDCGNPYQFLIFLGEIINIAETKCPQMVLLLRRIADVIEEAMRHVHEIVYKRGQESA